VFLNSPEAVFDLLDKRGLIYSDKPDLIMIGELCVFSYQSTQEHSPDFPVIRIVDVDAETL